jgi:hypothetical protein
MAMVSGWSSWKGCFAVCPIIASARSKGGAVVTHFAAPTTQDRKTEVRNTKSPEEFRWAGAGAQVFPTPAAKNIGKSRTLVFECRGGDLTAVCIVSETVVLPANGSPDTGPHYFSCGSDIYQKGEISHD